jgi:hypothetical protein
VPAAGLRWLVVARLSELAHDRAIAAALDLLFPGPRLAGFAIATGLDLREVSVGVAAGFDYATLYAAEVPTGGEVVEQRFIDRLVGEASTTRPRPGIVRISGALSGVPETLVSVRGHLVAVSLGDPTPARVAELYAEGRLGRSPSALQGSALSTLPPLLARAPLAFYAPGPFTGEWASGARGLLGAAVALGVAVSPDGDALRVTIVLTGRFDAVDAERLGSAWSDLEGSTMGRLLGLDRPIEPAKTSSGPDRLTLEVRLGLMPLVTGLRAAVAADVWEILNIPPPAPRPQAP